MNELKMGLTGLFDVKQRGEPFTRTLSALVSESIRIVQHMTCHPSLPDKGPRASASVYCAYRPSA